MEGQPNFPKKQEKENEIKPLNEVSDELFLAKKEGQKSHEESGEDREKQEKMREEEVLKMKAIWETKSPELQRKVGLAVELWKQKEQFPFPGITKEAYDKIKEDEKEEGYTDYANPVDDIIARCKQEGVKIVIVPGYNTISGNVYVLPFGSDDIQRDMLFPRHLQGMGVTNEVLREIIELDGFSKKAIQPPEDNNT